MASHGNEVGQDTHEAIGPRSRALHDEEALRMGVFLWIDIFELSQRCPNPRAGLRKSLIDEGDPDHASSLPACSRAVCTTLTLTTRAHVFFSPAVRPRP